MAKVKVIINGQLGETGTQVVRFDDAPEVRFDYTIAKDETDNRQFDLDWPLDAKTVTVRRDATLNGAKLSGETTAPIYDLAPFTSVLWREDLSFCRRMLMLNRSIGLAVNEAIPKDGGYHPKPRGLFSPYRLLRDERWQQTMYDMAAAHGVEVPAALASFAKLNIEPDMGGGAWCGPCQRLLPEGPPEVALMPNVALARDKGAEWARCTQEQFDVLMSVYQRAITVAADANHFSGVVWDPVGLSEDEVAVFPDSAGGDRKGPDGTFWQVNDDSWQLLHMIRDETGAAANAEYVMRQVFMEYFLSNIAEGFVNEEVVDENTVFIDNRAMSARAFLGDPTGWQPIGFDLYQF